jgi:hypothetical protein
LLGGEPGFRISNLIDSPILAIIRTKKEKITETSVDTFWHFDETAFTPVVIHPEQRRTK